MERYLKTGDARKDSGEEEVTDSDPGQLVQAETQEETPTSSQAVRVPNKEEEYVRRSKENRKKRYQKGRGLT